MKNNTQKVFRLSLLGVGNLTVSIGAGLMANLMSSGWGKAYNYTLQAEFILSEKHYIENM